MQGQQKQSSCSGFSRTSFSAKCFHALPLRLKNQDTLIKQSSILIKQSVGQVVPYQLLSWLHHCRNYCVHGVCILWYIPYSGKVWQAECLANLLF